MCPRHDKLLQHQMIWILLFIKQQAGSKANNAHMEVPSKKINIKLIRYGDLIATLLWEGID